MQLITELHLIVLNRDLDERQLPAPARSNEDFQRAVEHKLAQAGMKVELREPGDYADLSDESKSSVLSLLSVLLHVSEQAIWCITHRADAHVSALVPHAPARVRRGGCRPVAVSES